MTVKTGKCVVLICWIGYLLSTTVLLPIVSPYRSFTLWFGWMPTFLAWCWLWWAIIFAGMAIYVYTCGKQSGKGQEG
jgi:hypothetical protein